MTRTIQINYDLRAPGRNYQPLYDYIKSFGAYDPLLESLWLVRTTKTASDVRDDLMRLVDTNDRVAVFDVTNSDWATNFKDAKTAWIKDLRAA